MTNFICGKCEGQYPRHSDDPWDIVAHLKNTHNIKSPDVSWEIIANYVIAEKVVVK